MIPLMARWLSRIFLLAAFGVAGLLLASVVFVASRVMAAPRLDHFQRVALLGALGALLTELGALMVYFWCGVVLQNDPVRSDGYRTLLSVAVRVAKVALVVFVACLLGTLVWSVMFS